MASRLRQHDIGVNIDVDVLEDISDQSALEMTIKHEPSGTLLTQTAALSGTQIVRYTTTATGDLPLPGDWLVQVKVTQPGKTRRSALATFFVDEALA